MGNCVLRVMLFIGITMISLTWGFQAFTCENPDVVSEFTWQTSNCGAARVNSGTAVVKNGSLIQIPKFVKANGKVLTITMRIVRIYCSYFRLASLKLDQMDYVDFEPYRLDLIRARLVMDRMEVSFDHKTVRLTDNIETLVVDSINFDSDGYCKPYSTNIDIPIYKITLFDTEVYLHLTRKGKVEEITIFGERVMKTDRIGEGMLTDGSYLVWDQKDEVKCHLEHIYSGGYNEFNSDENQTVAVFDEISVGLILLDKMTLCNLIVYDTNDDFLYLAVEAEGLDSNKLNNLSYVSWASSILTSGQYLEARHVNMLNNRTGELIDLVCNINQALLQNTAIGAKTDPDLAAFRLTGEKGMVVNIVGVVLQLLKCKPLEYKFRKSTVCYLDLPVEPSDGSVTKLIFMDPVTFVLKTTTSKLGCHDHSNPIFEIRNQFYKFTPQLVKISKPELLPSNIKGLNKLKPKKLKGLYPHELATKAETLWTYSQSREAAVNKLINVVNKDIGYTSHSDRTTLLKKFDSISDSDIPDLVHYVFKGLVVLISLMLLLVMVVLVKIKRRTEAQVINNGVVKLEGEEVQMC